MSRCRHRYVRYLRWRDGEWHADGVGINALNWIDPNDEAAICIDCNHWLPLGPANDTPEVLVEVRAAWLADAEDSEFTDCEYTGLCEGEEYMFSGEPGIRSIHDLPPARLAEWHAGWLARCIQDHKESDRG